MDSLGAVDLHNALAAHFGIEMPATAAIDHPTMAALSLFISQQLPGTDYLHHSDDIDAASFAICLSGNLRADAQLEDNHPRALVGTDLVGIGCLYPGTPCTRHSADCLDTFLSTASAGASLQHVVPYQRWDVDWCYSVGVSTGRSYARFAAFAEVSLGLLTELHVCLPAA